MKRKNEHNATMPQEMDSSGYFVWLKKPDSEPRKVYVHDLVCETFNGPRPSSEHKVKHLDGDITNNKADNLAWTLPTEKQSE